MENDDAKGQNLLLSSASSVDSGFNNKSVKQTNMLRVCLLDNLSFCHQNEEGRDKRVSGNGNKSFGSGSKELQP